MQEIIRCSQKKGHRSAAGSPGECSGVFLDGRDNAVTCQVQGGAGTNGTGCYDLF